MNDGRRGMRGACGRWGWLALALALGFANAAQAERIWLKNGRMIEGWIVEENEVNVVVAIIRDATVGKLTLSTTEVEKIDRRRVESLEEALERAREERARRERLMRPATVTPTPTVIPAEERANGQRRAGDSAPEGEQATAGGEKKPLFEPLTDEEKAKVQRLVRELGDTRRAGGAAGRRERARRALVAMGPKVIPMLNEALDDTGNYYRRMNAATALRDIAAADDRIELYAESVPRLLSLLEDQHPWVRVSANAALEQIAGRSFGFPSEPTSWDHVSRRERQAAARWRAWWREVHRKLDQ